MPKDEINDIDVSFSTSFEVKEADPSKQWVRIGGTALTPITSRNGVTYTQQNILENDKKSTKFFMTHNLDPDNVIGHVAFMQEGDALMYDAKIRNTAKYPDVVQMAQDKFFDVSIDARYKKVKRVSVKEGEYQYQLEGMELRGLCAVGVGGVPSNSVDYAIAEEFKKIDDKIVKQYESQNEVNNMAEEENKLVKENEDLKKEVEKYRAKEAEVAEAHKQKIVDELKKLGVKEDDMKDKSVKELELVLNYEKKLKEKEVKKEGVAEVEEESTHEKEDADGIVIEKDGSITFNSKGYNDFNKEVREFIKN